MLDHFGILAPFYDRLIGPSDPSQLRDLLHPQAHGRDELADEEESTKKFGNVRGKQVADKWRPISPGA